MRYLRMLIAGLILAAAIAVGVTPAALADPTTPPAPPPNSSGSELCSAVAVGPIRALCPVAGPVAETAVAVAEFATDPLGWLAGKIADSATDLLGWVSKWAVTSTNPDLSVEWWTSAYAKGFAIGTVVFGFVLVVQLARSATGRIDGHEWLASMGWWVVGYFGGVFLGPLLGQMLINGFGYLSAGIISRWSDTSTTQSFDSVNEAVKAAAVGESSGKVIGALIVLIGVVISCFFLFISLSLQMVILYLSSALFAIAFVWVISAQHRKGAFKIPVLFIGLCASKPLLFLLLGVGMDIVKTSLFGDSGSSGQNLAVMVMAISVFMLAAFAPMLLLKFASVLPHGTGAAAGTAAAGGNQQQRSPAAAGKPSQTAALAGSRQQQPSNPTQVAANTGGGTGKKASTGSSAPATTGTPGRSGKAAAATQAGGAPSSAAAKLAAFSPLPVKAVAAIGGNVAARARRSGHNLTSAVGGEQPWQ
jgi:type IV secretion system protein TrbL